MTLTCDSDFPDVKNIRKPQINMSKPRTIIVLYFIKAIRTTYNFLATVCATSLELMPKASKFQRLGKQGCITLLHIGKLKILKKLWEYQEVLSLEKLFFFWKKITLIINSDKNNSLLYEILVRCNNKSLRNTHQRPGNKPRQLQSISTRLCARIVIELWIQKDFPNLEVHCLSIDFRLVFGSTRKSFSFLSPTNRIKSEVCKHAWHATQRPWNAKQRNSIPFTWSRATLHVHST